MERLILEYCDSDGCTYSCTNTVAFVYESKVAAIDDLGLLLLQYEEDRAKHMIVYEKLEDKQRIAYEKLVHVNNTKKNQEKITELAEECTKTRFACSDYLSKYLSTDQFIFGGASLEYESFFYNDSQHKKQISMPNIFTLDEYFQEVEKAI